jgi:hypothetical protein
MTLYKYSYLFNANFLHVVFWFLVNDDFNIFQAHLLSVFDNTKTVNFDEKVYDKILALNSQEGENIGLEEPINAQVIFVLIF